MFGVSYVLTKIILTSVAVEVWAFWRVIVASLTLLPFVYISWPKLVPALRSPRIYLAGLFGVALNQLFFAEGLQRTTPSHSALINSCIPVVTLILSIFFKRETWSLRKTLGILCAMAGVAVLIGTPTGGPPAGGQLSGDLLTLLNVTSFSIFLVMSQPLAKTLPSLGLTGFYLLEGVFILGLNVFLHESISDKHLLSTWTHASKSIHALMIFVAIQSTTITYVLNNWALRRATPSQVATYITLQPVIATLMGTLLLGEHLRPVFFPALLLVAGGVLFSVAGRRAKQRRHLS